MVRVFLLLLGWGGGRGLSKNANITLDQHILQRWATAPFSRFHARKREDEKRAREHKEKVCAIKARNSANSSYSFLRHTPLKALSQSLKWGIHGFIFFRVRTSVEIDIKFRRIPEREV
jgi:hypothetical protein